MKRAIQQLNYAAKINKNHWNVLCSISEFSVPIQSTALSCSAEKKKERKRGNVIKKTSNLFKLSLNKWVKEEKSSFVYRIFLN